MSLERIQRSESHSEILSISDNRFQIELAKYAYRHDHPDSQSPPRNEIMSDWVREHAADWRHVVEAHSEEKVSLHDAESLAKYYEELRNMHESGSDPLTMH